MRKYKYQDMTLNDPVGALLFLQQHVSQVGVILNKRLFKTNIKENLDEREVKHNLKFMSLTSHY